jgi:hypothetical protein
MTTPFYLSHQPSEMAPSENQFTATAVMDDKLDAENFT